MWSRDHTVLAALASTKVIFHLAATGRYGIFRDELYYLACARHLAWGYVDHPPLSIGVLAGVVATLGDSIFAIRLLPVLCGAAVVFLTGLLAREMGGGRFAQVLAALAVGVAPNVLAMSTFFSMNAFEQLIWLLGIHVLVQLVKTEDPRWWLLFGAIAGIGLLNKLSTAIFVSATLVGLVLTPWRRALLGPWLYAGGGVALVIFLPHLWWEIQNDWPFLQFVRAARQWAPAIPPAQFVANQILTHQPILAPLWIAGAAYLLFSQAMLRFRMLGVIFVATFLFFLLQESKDYYVTPVYPIAFAAGAIGLERALETRRWGHRARIATLAGVVLGGVVFTPIVMPLLAPATYVRYVAWLGLTPPAYLARSQTPFPQHLADRFGWEEMVVAIAEVYRGLPEHERASARILAGNWGEAGAVDYYGPRYGLPSAISPQHSYWTWGPGEGPVGAVIVLGVGNREELLAYFDVVEERGRVQHAYAVENDVPIYVARGLKRPIEEVWSEIRRF